MIKLLGYFGRFQSFRSRMGGMPAWARVIVALAAIPGAVMIALSIAAFLVSLLALFLLVLPAYRLVAALTGTGFEQQQVSIADPNKAVDFIDQPAESTGTASGNAAQQPQSPSGGRRQIEVTIIE
ncbi:MAG TPA: hypothetical protein VIL86_12920 [Tepidisphaeraceae bacterium]|jgi:hypothetical protein